MKNVGLLVSKLDDEMSLNTNALIMNSFMLYNLLEQIDGWVWDIN